MYTRAFVAACGAVNKKSIRLGLGESILVICVTKRRMAHRQTEKKKWRVFRRRKHHEEPPDMPQIDEHPPSTVATSHITSPNGCRLPKRILRTEAGCRPPSNCIAAIDFGTTNCSVAYNIIPSGKTAPLLLQFPGPFWRVPTAILFDKDGAVRSFGEEARTKYYEMKAEEIQECAYFEQIKMDLQHDEVRPDPVVYTMCASYTMVRQLVFSYACVWLTSSYKAIIPNIARA